MEKILTFSNVVSISETPGAKIYFTTDGSKPNPFQLKVAGRESTFKYKGPFSLKSGKRSLKAVALSRLEGPV